MTLIASPIKGEDLAPQENQPTPTPHQSEYDTSAAQERANQFLNEALARSSQGEISQAVTLFESWIGERIDQAPSRDAEAALRTVFVNTNAKLITSGPTDAHVLVGIQRQVLYLQRHVDLPLKKALDPIFDLLKPGDTSPAVFNAAAQSLFLRPATIAGHGSDYFIDSTLALLWEADTPELAQLPETLLIALARESGFTQSVLARLVEQIDPHLESWAINPAAAVASFTGTLPALDHTPAREAAGAVMGLALASPALDMGYLGPYLARGGERLATLEHNTVDGVIAVFSPTIFAKEKPASYPFSMQSFLQPMLGRPAWLQRDADAMANWTDFLDRVAALNDPEFSPIARQALGELQ